MTDHDPIDALLTDAFTAERQALPAAPIGPPVLSRMRRRRRMRQTVLGLGVATGVAAAAATAGPLLAEFVRTLDALIPAATASGASTTLTAAALALLLGCGAAMFLEEESSGL